MSGERRPRILSATSTSYDKQTASQVEIGITYDGLKNGPVDFVRIDPVDALSLAQRLVKAAETALRCNDRRAVEATR